MVLGLNDTLLECKDHSWTKALSKVDALFVLSPSCFFDYDAVSKKNLENVKKLWLYNDSFGGVSNLPNLEEIGIYATVENDDERISTQEKTFYSYSYKSTIKTTSETESNIDSESKKQIIEPVFEFNEPYKKPEALEPLLNAKKLKRITIAPCFKEYKLDEKGAAYIYAMSNVRDDIMINEPNKKLSKNSYMNINDLNVMNKNMLRNNTKSIVREFLDNEVKDVYSKAKKFKKKNKKHRIDGKALVYKAEPGSEMFKSKRVYHYNGKILDSDILGNSIQMPQRANDYKYFVYVYPTYKYYGKYNTGTKAYTETYWVQVFDMKNKIAYKSLKIGSKKPEQRFSYVGSSPKKHAGSVSSIKINKFIKSLG